MEVLSGGCEIETLTEVVEFASRNGLRRVLVDGIQEFGAIMKKPWLQTAFSKLNVSIQYSSSGKCKKQLPIFVLSLPRFPILILMLVIDINDMIIHRVLN